ncbi:hypothetical protein H5410_032101 [Solanum commersonii]|uniref:ATP-dependent DNA helicase n=1 Tax=Solanum commersonii TaxID=4109 RepID=A0A9J5YJ06_SOLCO|nr:hypothetical protein H5410_032101 [Solanum commersonii]
MIHGPCDYLNPSNSCMQKEGKCKFKYPKELTEQTTNGKNSYPLYKRPKMLTPIKVRGHNIDNSWIISYNPFLLKKFGCHINVEICSDIKVIKYIYQYICKGHDKIAFSVHNNDTNVEIDEIKEYQSARWVSPPEAAWRLFAFSISEMTPSVCQLQLHLDGQQFVSLKNNQIVDQIINNPMIRKTMLTKFFLMNKINNDAINLNLPYKEFPQHFVWSSSYKIWSRRKQRLTIGRIVTCHPIEGERYYLRLLLMNVRGPESYEDLRTIDGRCYTPFREAAEKRGLLHSDNNLIECMSEAVSYQMPYSLRRLFATLLVYCNPGNPKDLWNKYEDSMSEDFKIISNVTKNDIQQLVLNHINQVLLSMRHNINEFKDIFGNVSSSRTTNEAKEIYFERNIILLICILKKSALKKNTIKALDTLLKDLMNTKTLFSGKVVVFGGDFRQILPIVRNEKKEVFISQSLLYSDIWNHLKKLCLSENMRAKKDPAFSAYLMRIGNGQEKTNNCNKIEISNNFIIPFTHEIKSLNLLFNVTYPDFHTLYSNLSFITSRIILTTKNDFVDEINGMLIHRFPDDATVYTTIDETIEPNDQCQFEDFLHTLHPANLSPYRLTLKKYCAVILLRNLNPTEGLCNGTRLICHDFKSHVISATISSGDFKNKHFMTKSFEKHSHDTFKTN